MLYGDYNPSGKLPMTFPRNVGQVPIYYNYKSTGRPNRESHVFWSHYTDSENTPLYPFGFGLSYTKFEYSDLALSNKEINKGDDLTVSVKVTNTWEYNGKEVVQLYIRDLFGSITRPVKELKGFELTEIKKGESKTIEFTLSNKELGFFNAGGEFVVEPGDFEVFVGGNSSETLKETFVLK